MAKNLNLDPITFTGRQIETMKEAFWTAVFLNPQISTLLLVVPGIKAKQQVVILGMLGLVGKKKGAQCKPDVSDEQIDAIEKWWDPEYIEDRFEECWKDLLGKFTAWGLKNGIDKPDLTGTEFALFLEERIATALAESVYRIAFFGDKTIDNIADGGVLKDGVDIRYFNAINGFWKQLFAIATAKPDLHVAIAKNAGANVAAQKFTAQDTTDQVATGILESMVAQADERLLADPNVGFIVTKSFADQYKRERKKATGFELPYLRVEQGIKVLEYDGIPLYVLGIQDRIIKSYMTGAKSNLPHRVILTTIASNLQLGVEEESDLSALDAFYDKTEKTYIIDTGYSIDAMVVEDHMTVTAY